MTVSAERIYELALGTLMDQKRRIEEEIEALTQAMPKMAKTVLHLEGPPEVIQTLAPEALESNGNGQAPATPGKRGGARRLTEAGRLAISNALKARWAAKKKAARRGR